MAALLDGAVQVTNLDRLIQMGVLPGVLLRRSGGSAKSSIANKLLLAEFRFLGMQMADGHTCSAES